MGAAPVHAFLREACLKTWSQKKLEYKNKLSGKTKKARSPKQSHSSKSPRRATGSESPTGRAPDVLITDSDERGSAAGGKVPQARVVAANTTLTP